MVVKYFTPDLQIQNQFKKLITSIFYVHNSFHANFATNCSKVKNGSKNEQFK